MASDFPTEELKEMRKEARKENVKRTKEFLEENNIEWIESNTPNIVIVNSDSGRAYVSLQMQKYNTLKCRFESGAKWYTFGKKKFIEKFGGKK